MIKVEVYFEKPGPAEVFNFESVAAAMETYDRYYESPFVRKVVLYENGFPTKVNYMSFD